MSVLVFLKKEDKLNTAKVKFDFFSVRTAEGNTISFEAALNELLAMPPEESSIKIDNTDCSVCDSLRQKEYYAFLFSKIRMDRLPSCRKRNRDRRPLDLDDDEGLGEDMAIAYSPSLKIVSVQKNIHSMSANNIVKFVNEFFPQMQLSFLPIVKRDALERFARCGILKKARIKLQGTEDFSFLRNSNFSPEEKLTIQQMLMEPYVEIVYSVGRKQTSLSENIKQKVFFWANHHRSEENNNVLAVEITGKEDEEARTVAIDLLEDRLIYWGMSVLKIGTLILTIYNASPVKPSDKITRS